MPENLYRSARYPSEKLTLVLLLQIALWLYVQGLI